MYIWKYEIIANFLRLMFAYTTSDVYLTLRIKSWNFSIFMKLLYGHPWP